MIDKEAKGGDWPDIRTGNAGLRLSRRWVPHAVASSDLEESQAN